MLGTIHKTIMILLFLLESLMVSLCGVDESTLNNHLALRIHLQGKFLMTIRQAVNLARLLIIVSVAPRLRRVWRLVFPFRITQLRLLAEKLLTTTSGL